MTKENVSDNGSKKRKVPFSHTQTSSPCAATKLRFSQKVWVVCIDGCWWYIVADPNVWTWKCFLELWEFLSKIDKDSGELALLSSSCSKMDWSQRSFFKTHYKTCFLGPMFLISSTVFVELNCFWRQTNKKVSACLYFDIKMWKPRKTKPKGQSLDSSL